MLRFLLIACFTASQRFIFLNEVGFSLVSACFLSFGHKHSPHFHDMPLYHGTPHWAVSLLSINRFRAPSVRIIWTPKHPIYLFMARRSPRRRRSVKKTTGWKKMNPTKILPKEAALRAVVKHPVFNADQIIPVRSP